MPPSQVSRQYWFVVHGVTAAPGQLVPGDVSVVQDPLLLPELPPLEPLLPPELVPLLDPLPLPLVLPELLPPELPLDPLLAPELLPERWSGVPPSAPRSGKPQTLAQATMAMHADATNSRIEGITTPRLPEVRNHWCRRSAPRRRCPLSAP
jgi:hypothetical protein